MTQAEKDALAQAMEDLARALAQCTPWLVTH